VDDYINFGLPKAKLYNFRRLGI